MKEQNDNFVNLSLEAYQRRMLSSYIPHTPHACERNLHLSLLLQVHFGMKDLLESRSSVSGLGADR